MRLVSIPEMSTRDGSRRNLRRVSSACSVRCLTIVLDWGFAVFILSVRLLRRDLRPKRASRSRLVSWNSGANFRPPGFVSMPARSNLLGSFAHCARLRRARLVLETEADDLLGGSPTIRPGFALPVLFKPQVVVVILRIHSHRTYSLQRQFCIFLTVWRRGVNPSALFQNPRRFLNPPLTCYFVQSCAFCRVIYGDLYER